MDGQVIAGLDAGNETVRVLIGELSPDGEIVFSGWGSCPARGLLNGSIANIRDFQKCTERAVEHAEQKAGREVEDLLVSFGGIPTCSFNSKGVVKVSGKNSEVGQLDIDNVLDSASAVSLPLEQSILHILPQDYILDYQPGIHNPMNMSGVRLECNVHITTVQSSYIGNMKRAFERSGYRIRDKFLGSWASSKAALSRDEKNMGVLLIDIGSLVTDFMLVRDGMPGFSGSINIGGKLATHDLATVLHISMETAETLKNEYSSSWPAFADQDRTIPIQGAIGQGPFSIQASSLASIVEARMEDLFNSIKEEVDRLQGWQLIGGGLVLTGGGSLLRGMAELARKVFSKPVRVGGARSVLNLPEECCDPRWTTVAGLVQLGAESFFVGKGGKSRDSTASQSVLSSISDWLRRFF